MQENNRLLSASTASGQARSSCQHTVVQNYLLHVFLIFAGGKRLSLNVGKQAKLVLASSIIGVLVTFVAQVAFSLADLFFPYTNPTDTLTVFAAPIFGVAVYSAVPIIAGSVNGAIDRVRPWSDGLIVGLVAGVVNFGISVYRFYQIRGSIPLYYSQAALSSVTNEFLLFCVLIAILWGFAAALFSSWTAQALAKERVGVSETARS